MKRVLLALLFSIEVLLVEAAVGAVTEHGNSDPSASPTSMLRLLVTPEKFDGKRVEVRGYLRIESHDWDVCLTTDDLRRPLHSYVESQNCLRLFFDFAALGITEEEIHQFSGRLAYLEGTFLSFDQVPERHYFCVDGELTYAEVDRSFGRPGHLTDITRLRLPEAAGD